MLLQAYDFVHLYDKYRLRAASRRQRPVGQHHGRHRPGPADARRAAVRPHLPAAHEVRRLEDGQDRNGRGLALGRAHQPVPVLSVLDQRRRRRRRASACGCSPSCRARRSKRSTPRAQPTPAKRESQRRLAEELTRLVHGDEGLADGPAGDGDLLRRGDRRPERRAARRDLRRRAEPDTCRGSS